ERRAAKAVAACTLTSTRPRLVAVTWWQPQAERRAPVGRGVQDAPGRDDREPGDRGQRQSVGGVLAALPALASILAVFTHERQGPAAVAFLLRGMLSGMAGFVVFCALVAVLVDRAGVGATFTLAALAAVSVQAATALAARRSPLPGSA
ncbi:MAG TPA: hypothetical protein VF024_10675, partial [Solirubrobacteraceae bacterium]